MKVTNIGTQRLYLHDLRTTREAQSEGRPGEDRYLDPGVGVYLPNTSEVIRSAFKGDIRKYRDLGYVQLEDQVSLDANGGLNDSVTLTHNFGLPPTVYILKQVGPNWVDATGTVDISHNTIFTTTTVVNSTAFPLTFLIRLM